MGASSIVVYIKVEDVKTNTYKHLSITNTPLRCTKEGQFCHSIYKAKEVGPQNTKGVCSKIKGGQYLGCKVTILQANWVRSWRWLYDFVKWLWFMNSYEMTHTTQEHHIRH